MSYDNEDDKKPSLAAQAIASLVVLAVSGLYHEFATEKQTITNALVLDKELSWHLETTGSGKNRHTRIEWDHKIKTDKGNLREESSLWDGKFGEGEIFKKLTLQKAYDFVVNRDKLTGMQNILEASFEGQQLGELYTLPVDIQEQRKANALNITQVGGGQPQIYVIVPELA